MRPSSKRETITPALAKKWLTELNYTDNRNINEAKVAYLARQIKQGLWVLNNASIGFDKKGNLIDGQHRLSACVQAKKSIETFVVRGLETEAYTTIDQGWKRSHPQILTARGEKWAAKLVAACKRIWVYEASNLLVVNRQPEVSIDEVDLVLEVHGPEVRECVKLVMQARCHLLRNGGLFAYCAWLFQKGSEAKMVDFFTSLGDGLELKRGSPILCLRNKLIKAKIEKTRYNDLQVFSFIVRAWNAYYRNKTLTVLRVTQKGEDITLPKVAGL